MGNWKVVTEEGKRKYCELTGRPINPVNYYWVKDQRDATVSLFAGSAPSERAHAYLFAAAPDMVAAIENALEQFKDSECNCDGEYIDGRLVGHACYFHRIEQELKDALAKAKVGQNE